RLNTGNGNCGTDFITKTICVSPTPDAAFTVDGTIGCAPFTVRTTVPSTAPVCGAYKYQWTVRYASTSGCNPPTIDFNYLSGTSSTSQQPIFQFINPGVYTLELVKIVPAAGCTSVVVTRTVT